MSRKQPEERREEILRAAGQVVMARGFRGTSVRDLADQIGVSSGLLHHYFPSMDDIFARAVELFADEDEALLATAVGSPDEPPLVRIARTLRFCVPDAQDPSCLLWVDAWTASLEKEQMRVATRDLNRVWRESLRDLIEQAVAAGDATCADSDGAALILMALVDGLTVQMLVHEATDAAQVLAVLWRTAEDELDLVAGTLARVDAQAVAAAGPDTVTSPPHRSIRTNATTGSIGSADD